jgi:hypothetical protein
MESLHQHIEVWRNEDVATRSWDGNRLHEEVTAVQNAWTTAAAAPTAQVSKLTQDNRKLMLVTEKVVETGVVLKKKLKEALDVNGKLVEVNSKNLARGRSWKKFAEGLQASQAKLNEKYDIATRGLEVLAERYKALRTESNESSFKLGRRVLQLEFAEQLKTNTDVATKLKEAKTLDDLVAIRESLVPAKGKTKPVAESKDGKPGEKTGDTKPGQPISESKETKPETKEAKEPDNTKEHSIGKQGTMIVQVGNPLNITESISIARRLSKASNAGPTQ